MPCIFEYRQSYYNCPALSRYPRNAPHSFLFLQGKAHPLGWALLCGIFASTPRDPDSVSITARSPLARIPIAHRDGLRSPLLVRVSGQYRTLIVVLMSIVTRQSLLTTMILCFLHRHLQKTAPNFNDCTLARHFYRNRTKHG